MGQEKSGNIPLVWALVILAVVAAIVVCCLSAVAFYFYGSIPANFQSSVRLPTRTPRNTPVLPRAQSEPAKPAFPVITFYVRVPEWKVDYDEIDVYVSFEAGGVEKTLDLDGVPPTLISCRNDECTWKLGPFTIDRGSWVYLTAYNDSTIECEIIVNGERLDAANGFGAIATCSGWAR